MSAYLRFCDSQHLLDNILYIKATRAAQFHDWTTLTPRVTQNIKIYIKI